MKNADVLKMKPFDIWMFFIKERYNIYIKKSRGRKPPWTDNEALQEYFFCNCYREMDKVTQWFRTNVRDPLKEKPEVVFATICFRWFNWIPTGEVLMGFSNEFQENFEPMNLLVEWDLDEAIRRLEAMKQAGEKVFTGAFNISNSGSRKPKINRVCEDYIQPVWEARKLILQVCERHNLSMKELHKYLMGYPGLKGSGFMAYEVVCDLRYTWVLRDASDKMTWSNPGPGAKRGLNRLLGRPIDTPVKDWPVQSAKLLDMTNKALPIHMPKFEMREIEHGSCEIDKFIRAMSGDGHMKRRYKGHG